MLVEIIVCSVVLDGVDVGSYSRRWLRVVWCVDLSFFLIGGGGVLRRRVGVDFRRGVCFFRRGVVLLL